MYCTNAYACTPVVSSPYHIYSGNFLMHQLFKFNFLIFKKIIYIIQILENIKIYTVRNCSLLSVSITSNQFPFLQTTNIIRFCVSFQRYFMYIQEKNR